MLRAREDVYQEIEAGDQSMADHLVVLAAVGEEVEENYDVDLCYGDLLLEEEKKSVSDFPILESDTAANSMMEEFGVEAEVGGLHCSFRRTLICWRE